MKIFGPIGTPFENRALNDRADYYKLNTYEVMKPFEELGGIASPAHG